MPDDVISVLGEAQRALTRQGASVDTMRTRAATVFSASGITAALFTGRFRVGVPSHHLLVAVAAVLVLVGTGATVFTLIPRNMRFNEDLSPVLDQITPGGASQNPPGWAAHRAALGIYQMLEKNRGPVRSIAWAYGILCVAFGFQVAIWVVVSLIR